MDPQQRIQGEEQVFITDVGVHVKVHKERLYMCMHAFQPFEVVQTCVSLSLKGSQTTVYRVTLMSLVSNTAD